MYFALIKTIERMSNMSKLIPDVTIALLTWNRKSYLDIGLPSMFTSLSKRLLHEILIMDNASTDGTTELIERYAASNMEVKFIKNSKNLGLKGYNKLFGMAKGRVIIEVDDDVIAFPENFDETLVDSLDVYSDYGFMSLDTIHNDLTDGGRPCPGCGRMDERGRWTVEEGDARGYCAAFRRRDYRMIRPFTFFFPFSLRYPQDYVVSGLMRRLLKRRSGVVVGEKCLHANGPLYAAKFGRVDMDLQKMAQSDCPERVEEYKKALREGRPYSP